jgi:hypothetical protein
MATTPWFVAEIDDQSLAAKLRSLVADERGALADFIVHLVEFDRRRLYAPAGCSSLFLWLTDHLRLPNASAFRRVMAARLQARMPIVADHLRDGRITLTKLGFLKDLLTEDNCRALLEQASTLSEKQVEELAAARGAAAPAPRDTIRPLPPPPKPAAASARPDLFMPRAAPVATPSMAAPQPDAPPRPMRHQITMTVGSDFMARLTEVRAALSHSHPNATLETLFDECMTVTLAAHRRRVEAETDRPRSGATKPEAGSRHIPNAVRRLVWKRDGRRCTFVSADGVRCSETRNLQLHHDHAHARGGPATEANVRVTCRCHNDYLARVDFGDDLIDRLAGRRPAQPLP